MPLRIELGDVAQMKKKHPCGNDLWEVVRTGMDIRIKCQKCGRQVLMPREIFEKRVKRVLKADTDER
ncbi:MAG: DUF951 domain-containing protein [Firmicutes bacterium]|nr:DUF951 domain-containing protein [Bacillota bacterium]MDD3298010.1 DUF951 domain-containing protein [Bacillota bacterium]MDD3850041.1 DUF951 domain-containing protein [Bacillota bacterium]MDD4706722.1 DUF951 domain-containing protein [Bacillota bacterium]